MPKSYLILSGKGGVGKTTIATSLAVSFASHGIKCALVDGDVGLRCVDQLLGMQNDIIMDAGDVLEQNCDLSSALNVHPRFPALSVLSAPQFLTPSDIDKKAMEKLLRDLKKEFDIVLIDCPAGIGRGLKNLWSAADDAIVVATPDDVCLRDAERVGTLLFEKKQLHPYLILNRYDRSLHFDGLIRKPAEIAQSLDMPLLSVIPYSDLVYRALVQHKSAFECANPVVRRAIQRTADRMLGLPVQLPRYCR